MVHDDIKGAKVNLPTQFLIFDLEGNYQQTIETGYQISDFCYDKDNDRIVMNFDYSRMSKKVTYKNALFTIRHYTNIHFRDNIAIIISCF